MNSPETKSEHKTKAPAPKVNAKRPSPGLNNVQTVGKKYQPPASLRYQARRTSRGSTTLYVMAIGACILLGGSYLLYLSTASQGTWYTAPSSDATYEPTTTVAVKQPVPAAVVPTPSPDMSTAASKSTKLSIRPNAVVDVPNVGLRNVPDIHLKASPASLRRGDRVEVLKKISGKGPAWVKIRTASGKVGWVIASVVTPKKTG